MEDIKIICCDCKNEFVFPVKEQMKFSKLGFVAPKRCKACRIRKKQDQVKKEQEIVRQQEERLFETKIKEFNEVDILTINFDEDSLVVTGNGFDIMHGVPSSYYDFQSTIGKKNPLRFYLENYLNTGNLWGDFEGALGHLKVSNMLNPINMDSAFYDSDFYEEDGAAEYFMALEGATEPAIWISYDLPRRFRMWVESLTLKNPNKPFEKLITSRNRVLNFNYTEFIETLYEVKHENVCYIHGCRVKQKYHPKEKLILGHSPDEFDEEYGCIDDNFPDYIKDGKRYFIKNAMENALIHIETYDEKTTKHSNKIIEAHQDFFDSLGGLKRVVVIGHSMSDVDHPYFAEIIGCSNNDLEWYIGCHTTNDLNNVKAFAQKMHIPKSRIKIFRT